MESANANKSRKYNCVKLAIKSPFQYLFKTFTYSVKVTLPDIRKGLVKVTYPSTLQHPIVKFSTQIR